MLAVSILAAILFSAAERSVVADLGSPGEWSDYRLAGEPALNVLAKGIFGVTLMIWARWSLPRLRIDQVMTTCLKYCIPLAAAMMVGVTLWAYMLPSGLVNTWLRPPARSATPAATAAPVAAAAQPGGH